MSEAPTEQFSPESPMEASVIDMSNDVEKSCVCPICKRTFAWPLSMVDHVIIEHGPIIVDACEFSASIVLTDRDGIFWRYTSESCAHGIERQEERLLPRERVDYLYHKLTTRDVVCDGFSTTIIGNIGKKAGTPARAVSGESPLGVTGPQGANAADKPFPESGPLRPWDEQPLPEEVEGRSGYEEDQAFERYHEQNRGVY